MLMVHILLQVVFHRYGVNEKLGIDLLPRKPSRYIYICTLMHLIILLFNSNFVIFLIFFSIEMYALYSHIDIYGIYSDLSIWDLNEQYSKLMVLVEDR